MAVLRIRTREGKEILYPLRSREITIGKNDPAQGIINDIPLEDLTVSRRHARLIVEKGVWYLEDLKSKNSTYVNGIRIQRVALRSGDRIQIGQHLLIFEDTAESSPFPWERIAQSFSQRVISHDTTVDINYLLMEKLGSLVLRAESLEGFLSEALSLLAEVFRVKKILILTRGGGSEGLELKVFRGGKEYAREIVTEAIQTRKVLLYPEDPSFPSPSDAPFLLVAPLLTEDRCLGVIYLEQDSTQERFQEKDRILIQTLSHEIAYGMERVQLYARIREETRIRAQLERFFSPQVVELILKESQLSPDLLLPPRRVEGTFLFADIQGFSLLAERLEPGEVAELLRDYFTVMTEVIFEHQGTVDKYIGDCILAVFGVPFPYEDHPERAVTCALEILARHREFVTARDERKRFHIRVGINTGEAVAGYIGSPRRLEYTVLGEAVIVAERLQSFAEPDQIYIGRRTYERIRGRFPVTFLGRFAPKGGKEIEVYRIEVERERGIKG